VAASVRSSIRCCANIALLAVTPHRACELLTGNAPSVLGGMAIQQAGERRQDAQRGMNQRSPNGSTLA
jgi:hypothetical protein